MSMRRTHQTLRISRRQHGVSLITAVFLLVVLAGLLAAMVRVLTVQQASSGLDMLGIQAYQAARSGLDWGIYQQLRVQPPSVLCFPSQTFAMPASGTLRNFSVTVTCTPKSGNVAGDTTNRWSIVAIACNAPAAASCPAVSASPDYVSRRVQAELN